MDKPILDSQGGRNWTRKGVAIECELTVNDGYHYVRVKVRDIPGTLETVARIIAGAGRRQCVKYENGDRADLRRSNLYFGDGHAKHDTVARLTPETVH